MLKSGRRSTAVSKLPVKRSFSFGADVSNKRPIEQYRSRRRPSSSAMFLREDPSTPLKPKEAVRESALRLRTTGDPQEENNNGSLCSSAQKNSMSVPAPLLLNFNLDR